MSTLLRAISGRIPLSSGRIGLVEQDVMLAFELARHGFVLEGGRTILSGPTADLARDPRVRAAYLGLTGA